MYTSKKEYPALGLKLNLTSEEYREINAISTSEINKLDTTLAHWKVSLDEKIDSQAVKVGNAVDSLVQGIEVFNAEFAVLPYEIDGEPINLRLKAHRQFRDQLMSDYGQDRVLKQDEFDRAMKCKRALESHPEARKYLSHVEWWQPSLVWKDHASGLPRKCRWDALAILGEKRFILDIKTIRAGQAFDYFLPDHFYQFGYHRQAFAYLEAAARCGIVVDGFVFLFVDSDQPHSVAVREPHEEALQVAAKEIDERMKKIAVAVTQDFYPGYDELGIVNVPKWVRERNEPRPSPVAYPQEF